MAKPKGNNRSSGRAEPRGSKGAEPEINAPGVARPNAKDAAAKAVAKPPGKSSSKSSSKPADRKPASGPRPKPAPTKRTTPSPTGRYTPPIPKSEKVSPLWVPIVMFSCLGIGMAIIILNYVNVLPGSDPSNVYLMIGLALITIGFITATKYH
ncbi:MAG: cell division protein CrgA [Acidimicrobiales bacterium]